MALISPTSKEPSIFSSRLRDYTFFTDRDSDGDFHRALVAAISDAVDRQVYLRREGVRLWFSADSLPWPIRGGKGFGVVK